MKIKKILFSVVAVLITTIFVYYFNPLEKLRWSTEQNQTEKGAVVIYSQWSDRFMYRLGLISGENTIFTAYKADNGRYVLSHETNRHYKNINIDFDVLVEKLCGDEAAYHDVKQVEMSNNKYTQSEYFLGDTVSKYRTFYVINDRFLIENDWKEITNDFVRVYIYDLETKQRYFYPEGIIANVPENTDIDTEKYLEPVYYMDEKGRILCFYKYYNKIYCKRLN